MRVPVLALLLTFAAHSATAAETPDTNPDWIKKPTAEQLRVVYPIEAARKGIRGSAIIECKVSLEGALFDCLPISETPKGMGFGAAAVALTTQFLMKPATRGGKPVVTTVRMPINFDTDGPITDAETQTQTLLGNQIWLSAPSYAEAVAAFPQKARNSATPGHVSLNCDVVGGGALKGCEVISEEPKGLGFGRAALDLAAKFKAPLTVEDGRSTKGMAVHLPIIFPIEMLGNAPRVGKPGFVTLPQPEDIPRDLPHTAEPVTVRVIIDCLVAAAGRLQDCKVESQTPAGFDLSAASLAMAPKFGLTLWTPEGLPTIGARVRIPLRFDLK